MKKRFSGLVREIQDQQTEVQRVKTDLARASATNRSLQKDIQVTRSVFSVIAKSDNLSVCLSHINYCILYFTECCGQNLKKDIEERDVRIREKEKKIYDLKVCLNG